jgi:serine/threonine-protein kinase RsbW
MNADPDDPLELRFDRVGRSGVDSGTDAQPGQAGGSHTIHRRFRSGNSETRAALGDLCGRLAAQGLPEDDLGTIELVLAEALNNITEHAYGPEGGLIEVMLDLTGPEVLCELRDFGRPMPMGEAPVTELPLISPPDVLPEGGFGWHIIRCLVSDLRYERADGHNRLCMAVALSDPC